MNTRFEIQRSTIRRQSTIRQRRTILQQSTIRRQSTIRQRQSPAPFLYILLIPAVFLMSCGGPDRPNLKPHQQKAVQNHTFPDWYGEPVQLSDFRGKVVIIDFWETWCGPCLSAFPGFQQALDEFPDDLVIIAATLGSRDNRDIALEFIGRHDYSFIYVDGSGLAPKIGIRGIPFKVVVDREGNIDGYMVGSGGAESEYQMLKSLIREL